MSRASDLPALLGGTPLRPEGPPSWPRPDDAILAALQASHASGSWGRYRGSDVLRLEAALCDYHQVEHACTCGSGTFAVEAALRALKIGAGDEVLLAAYDYPGNFLSVHAVGARPVLLDVAAPHWNLDPRPLEAALAPASKALIVSHLHGGLVPMARLMELARRHGLAVIEDAAQCPGAWIEGRRAGSWGDLGVLSFGGSKLLTAGRGGALLTARADLAQRLKLVFERANNHICPLSELQAAVLLPQLAALDEHNARRHVNVQRLVELLADVPGVRAFHNESAVGQPAYYKLGLQYDAEVFGLPRTRFVCALRAEGIAMDEGFRALHVGRSAARYRAAGDLAEATRAHQGTLILHHPILLGTAAEMAQIATAFHKVHAHAARLRG